jgi:hypothetical protein
MAFKSYEEVRGILKENPSIVAIRFSNLPGLGGKAVYVVFYAHKSDGIGGVGGCTLTQEDFQRIRDEFGEQISFRNTGTYEKIEKTFTRKR